MNVTFKKSHDIKCVYFVSSLFYFLQSQAYFTNVKFERFIFVHYHLIKFVNIFYNTGEVLV